MASSYPTAYDVMPVWADGTSPTDTSPAALLTAADMRVLSDAIVAIQTTMGLSPSDTFATVAARLDALAVAADVTAGYAPRRWDDFPMRQPAVMASPPTVTAGVANAASAIAGSVRVPPFRAGAFTYLGAPQPRRALNFVGFMGVSLTGNGQTSVYAQTSIPPWAAEFWLDTADATGRFEVVLLGQAAPIRVAIEQADGTWGYVTSGATFNNASGGDQFRNLVTLGAAGRYKIRLEFAGNSTFIGLEVAPTDTVQATNDRRKRYIVVGDSFTEPTIVDTPGTFVGWDGWVGQLAYLTGYDTWAAGSGSTGYLNPGTGGRVKFRDRLSEITSHAPDGIIFAGGINDYSFGSYSYAAIYAEALACFNDVKAAVPGVDLLVLSPFGTKSMLASSAAGLMDASDALRAAATAAGATFLDLLSLPSAGYLESSYASTLQASAAGGATSVSVGDVPVYFKQANSTPDGFGVRIGSGPLVSEARSVTNITGAGPYTLTVSPALAYAHASGEPVTLHGESYMTGVGNATSPTGSGNADRYVGTDTTHPTRLGHHQIARVVALLWQQALASL